MSDIRERMVRAMLGEPFDLKMLQDAAEEIARLREEKAADWKAACDSALAGTIEVGRLKAEIARLRLTDAEQDDLRTWQLECWRQGEAATEGGNEELAQRWIDRRKRAFAMLERHAKGGET